MLSYVRSFLALMTVACVIALPGAAQQRGGFETIYPVHHDVSPPLRDIPPLPEQATRHVIPLMRPNVNRPGGGGGGGPQTDPVVQSSATTATPATLGTSFEGVGDGFFDAYGVNYNVNVAPPDTNGAVGATQYVQWVNLSYAVFSKSGSLLYGPAAGNTFWTGFGGPCETTNDGDPIIQYDKLNDVWVAMQLVYSQGKYLCLAVSQNSDATGSFNRYAYKFNVLTDYPKLGVWRDGYYVSFNQFKGFGAFAGPAVCALNGAAMRTGGAAPAKCFALSTSYASLLPGDIDSSTQQPPAGTPEYFLSFGNNTLLVWRFQADWNSSTFSLTGPQSVSVPAFNQACGGGACIPQLGTSQQLDSLGDRLMYRLAYRNFGSTEYLVVNHAVQVGSGSSAKVGVRWYQLRNTPGSTAAPTVAQASTYLPDNNFRWMGSAAMDHVGNIAVGYSVSSSSMNPAIRIAGTTGPNTLGSELAIINGTGSQNGGLDRWGDYSALSIDPVDDCTMYFTSEYLSTDGSFNWHTRIGKLKFNNCP